MDTPPGLIIDAGALFFQQPALAANTQKSAKRTAQGVARVVKAMDTKAVGVSLYDLAGGVEFLQQIATANKLSLLSMNLYSNQNTSPIFAPYLFTKVGDMQVAILGLTGTLADNQKKLGLSTRPWQEILPEVLEDIEGKADMTILLSSASRKDNEEIARKFKTLHLIIQSGTSTNNQAPVQINNTLLCQTAGKGKYMGILQIDWDASQTWKNTPPDQLSREHNRLDRINWQIGRMKKRLSLPEQDNNEQFQHLLTSKESTEQDIKQLEKNKKSSHQSFSDYQNSFIALKTSLPEDNTVKALVDQTRKEVNQINRKAQEEQRKNRRSTTSRQDFPPSLQELAGWETCSECHQQQVQFYLTTSHANALETLVKQDQQYNPDCLLCHVTLPVYDYTQIKKLNILGRMPQELQNVSCEACHGPARRHTLNPEVVLPGKPNQAVCRQCHTDERDDNFIFSAKILKIQCPKG